MSKRPRTLDSFTSLDDIANPEDECVAETQWWRGQCSFRGLDWSGSPQQVRSRLRTLPDRHELEACFKSFHLEAEARNWNEDLFMTKLRRVMQHLEDHGAPIPTKVQAGNRLAALRACATLKLAHQSLHPLPAYQNQSRWVVIGKEPACVREKAAEIKHMIETDIWHRAAIEHATARARQQQQEEEAIEHARARARQQEEQEEQEGSIETAMLRAHQQAHREEEDEDEESSDEDVEFDDDSEEESQQEGNELAGLLERIPRASRGELQNIKQRYLMYDGEVLDPDVDVWIPEDPKSARLGLIPGYTNERLKSYWVAQCFLRGIAGGPQDSIISLQARLRDRSEATEERIEPLKEFCEQVLDAEWRLDHPRARFNVRAVRKGWKIMLQPEENAIARNHMTARVIRKETLARLRMYE